jgi:acetoacetate decarboxylase
MTARSSPYKFKEMDPQQARKALTVPTVVLKIIPDPDGTIRIAELVRFEYSVTVKGAWDRPRERDPVSSCSRSPPGVAGTRNCIGISYLQRQLD